MILRCSREAEMGRPGCAKCVLHTNTHSAAAGVAIEPGACGEEQPVGMKWSSCGPCHLETQPSFWRVGLRRRRSTSQDVLGLLEAGIAKGDLVICGPPDCPTPHLPIAATLGWLWPRLLEPVLKMALESPPFLPKKPQCVLSGKPSGVV